MYNTRNMMINHKNTFFLGLFILATQYLFGLPSFWKSLLITIAVLFIILSSVKINLPRKNVKFRAKRDRNTASVPQNNLPISPTPTPVAPTISGPFSTVKSAPIVDVKPKTPRRTSTKKTEIV